MRRLLRALIIGLALVVLALGAGAGVLAWRLAQGPISLAPVSGILAAMIDRGTPYRVSFAQPELTWSRKRDSLYLTVHDVTVKASDGAFVAAVPDLSVRADAWALVRNRSIVLREVELDLPALQLTRERDGHLTLSFAGKLTALPLARATRPEAVGQLLGGGKAATDPRLAQLHRIRVSAPSLQILDEATGRRLETTDAGVRLTRGPGGWELLLTMVPGAPGSSLQVRVRPGEGQAMQAVQVEMGRLPASFVDDLLPQVDLTGTDVTLSGRIEGQVETETLRARAVRFELRSSAGTVAAPGFLAHEVALGPSTVRGETRGDWRDLELRPLSTTLDGHPVAVTTGSDPTAGLTFELSPHALPAAQALDLWPLTVAPQARAWVTSHVQEGVLTDFTLTLRPDRHVAIDAGLRALRVQILDSWPAADSADGRVRVVPGRVEASIDGARLGDIRVGKGSVRIVEPGPDQPSVLTAVLPVAATVPAAAQFLARPPLSLASPIEPRRMGGRIAAEITSSMPLIDQVPRDAITTKVTGHIDNLSIEQVLGNRDLGNGELDLAVDDARARVNGSLALAGVPLRVEWTELLHDRKLRRRVLVQGAIDPAQAQALGFAWQGFTGGKVGVKAALEQPLKGVRTADVGIDLAPAQLRLPQIGLGKEPGAPGRASFVVRDDRPQRLGIDKIDIDLTGAKAQGSVQLDPGGGDWRAATIDRFTWPRGALSADLTHDAGVIGGTISADRLDLRGLSPGNGAGPGPGLALRLDARALLLAPQPFAAVTATLDRRGGRWRRLDLKARTPGGGTASVRLDAAARVNGLTGEASDFGALLQALGLGAAAVKGGHARLAGQVQNQKNAQVIAGMLKVREFMLGNAPVTARILSLASLQGIANTLGGKGLYVDKLTVPFTYDGAVVGLRQARLVGSELGVRVDGSVDLARRRLALDGTLAPIYTINRLLGRVPVLGDLLRGDRADAALAATFSVRGTFANPDLSVNPLAALVPGAIRDLFRGLEADGDQQPAPARPATQPGK